MEENQWAPVASATARNAATRRRISLDSLLSEEVSQVRDGYGQKVKIWEAKNVWEAKIKMS